jgi:biotin/methionine sulfoxide reductase
MHSYTATHWGIHEVVYENGRATGLKALQGDPAPSPIADSTFDAWTGPLRVHHPAVRRSWLEHGPGTRPELRGSDPFVEVSWDEVLDLTAGALRDVIARRGNSSIFGGSYGWSSAGRFHHAQSQVHRFLNAVGGYVRHTDSYSLGAARVLMPHIVAPIDELMKLHTSWDVLAAHTRMFVSLGGVPAKNAQVGQGLVGRHQIPQALNDMHKAGVRFVNISPVASDIDTGGEVEWIAIRPNTDTALLLALAYTLYTEGLHDQAFLARYCVGFDRFAPYLTGAADGTPKTPAWAQAITGIPAQRIAELARDMAATRTMITASWSLQRSHHGEQPFWMTVTLAAMLGQIGLPGGGFGVGYGATNGLGKVGAPFGGPTLQQGNNAVKEFIPVARIVDMLEKPGAAFTYNGKTHHYPDIELIYWAGGNPFHHHQDLNRMRHAWCKPGTVVVHEQFWTPAAKLADIVLPATTTIERNDIGFSGLDSYLVAMKRALEPVGSARDDYDIFADIAGRLGAREAFTEGLDADQWLSKLYDESRLRAESAGIALPAFDDFWERGIIDLTQPAESQVMLGAFRADPVANPLKTASGKIEIFCETIAGFQYEDCPGHAQWFEPIEWLGSPTAQQYPLHMISDQPFTKLHSQLDHARYSRDNKIAGREPVTLHPGDAAARGIRHGDVVRVWNGRGECLAGALLSDRILPGVVKLSTGAWYDPSSTALGASLEKHGNPNVLTLDIGASSLSQGCIAQTCLVDVAPYVGTPPPVTAFALPTILCGGDSHVSAVELPEVER